MATTANDNRTYRRRAIDFTSNSPNMTTMTCQRNRIVSPAGIVSIRRYILLRSGIFSRRRQEDARHLKKTRPASRVAIRWQMKETAEDKLGASATTARRRAIDFLSSSRVYDISPRFDTTRNLSACHACLSRTAVPAPRTRRVFVCRRERRADAAWISRKSGRIVQHEIYSIYTYTILYV